MLLGIREEKESWLQIYCPGSLACDDDGELWSLIVMLLNYLYRILDLNFGFFSIVNSFVISFVFSAQKSNQLLLSA
jgi:hypothetical protein